MRRLTEAESRRLFSRGPAIFLGEVTCRGVIALFAELATPRPVVEPKHPFSEADRRVIRACVGVAVRPRPVNAVPSDSTLLSSVEVAGLLRCSRRTVTAWARQGTLPSVGVDTSQRFRPDDSRRELLRKASSCTSGICTASPRKSTIAKSLAVRSIAFGRKVYVPGDPKGEWSVVSKAVGGIAIELGSGTGNRLNPLDDGPAIAGFKDSDWAEETRNRQRALLGSLTETALRRSLGPTEQTALDVALADVRNHNTVPILPHVVAALFTPRAGVGGSSVQQLTDDGRQAGHGLQRLVGGELAGLFDGPSTVRFDPTAPMVSLDLSRIARSDEAIAMVMTCASSWMESALSDPSGGQRWVIYDEAWRLLRQPSLLARMQSQWKLSRALGIANLMIIGYCGG